MAKVPEEMREIILAQVEDFNKAKYAFEREDVSLRRLLTVAIGAGNSFDISTWEIRESSEPAEKIDILHIPEADQ